MRKAHDILKWIAIAVPIFMTFSFLIGFYDSAIDLAYEFIGEGNYGIFTWIGVITELIIGIIVGLGISLLCLFGLAIHFFRTMHSNE